MFSERCDRGAISYLEGERVPKNWCLVTETYILVNKVNKASKCIMINEI